MVWKGIHKLLLVGFVAVVSLFFANTTQAAELVERKIFYLDWGFVGRPVSLDVNGGKTTVSWEAGDLTAPTVLMIEIEKDTDEIAPSNVTFGQEVVHLTWADPYHLSARGVKVVNQDGCNPGDWTVCSLYREIPGDGWTEALGGRAYGHVRVRMGTKLGDYMHAGSASWYKYKGCRCAASPDFPKGTRLRVRSVANPQKYTVVRVNDFGPERDKFPERVIDLDIVAFQELAPKGAGVIKVTVEPVAITDADYKIADALPASIPTPIKTPVAVVPAPAITPVATAPTWSY
ncbi:MAG: RlpA-like double-psi beta-barrel domain-containing protein [Patescibacteria group bacterium]|jgi:hypothetical protein